MLSQPPTHPTKSTVIIFTQEDIAKYGLVPLRATITQGYKVVVVLDRPPVAETP